MTHSMILHGTDVLTHTKRSTVFDFVCGYIAVVSVVSVFQHYRYTSGSRRQDTSYALSQLHRGLRPVGGSPGLI